jgi:hypothetical protein
MQEVLQRMQSGQLTSPELMQVLCCAVLCSQSQAVLTNATPCTAPQPGRPTSLLIHISQQRITALTQTAAQCPCCASSRHELSTES